MDDTTHSVAPEMWAQMDAAQDAALDALVAAHVAYALEIGRICPEEADAKRADIKWHLDRWLSEYGLV